MVQLYHMHATVSSIMGTCRTVGTHIHHSSCSTLPGFTNANEVSCTLRPGTVPPSTKCKCIHEVPAPAARRLPKGVRRVAKRAAKRKGAKSKKRKARSQR